MRVETGGCEGEECWLIRAKAQALCLGLAGAHPPEQGAGAQPGVVAVRVASLAEKEILLGSEDGRKLFTEPYYNGFPATLVRLAAIEPDELEELITDARRCQAPRILVEQFDRRVDG
jgi:hypothetical protein